MLILYIALGGVLVSCDSVGFSALVGDFQLPVVGISRVGIAHPDFFQGGRLPTLPPLCRRPCVACYKVERW